MHIIAAVVFGLSVGAFTVAAPAESNGERLARGLPPLRPEFGRILPGFVNTHNPTPAFAAKRGLPSYAPTTYTGQIDVRTNLHGQSIGTVQNWAGSNPVNGVDQWDPQHSLHVSFITSSSGPSGPFDVSVTNALFQAPYFLGLVGQSSLGTSSAQAVELSNVNQTPPHSPPIHGFQSAIWSFDPTTKELTVKWVNPDGSTPGTIIAFDSHNNKFIVTGDLDEWNHENPGINAFAVYFFLIPV